MGVTDSEQLVERLRGRAARDIGRLRVSVCPVCVVCVCMCVLTDMMGSSRSEVLQMIDIGVCDHVCVWVRLYTVRTAALLGVS